MSIGRNRGHNTTLEDCDTPNRPGSMLTRLFGDMTASWHHAYEPEYAIDEIDVRTCM